MKGEIKQLNDEDIAAEIKRGNIVYLLSGKRMKMFLSSDNVLCYIPPSMRRRGFAYNRINGDMFEVISAKRGEDEKKFALISKYRKLANSSTLQNDFISACLSLPSNFDRWVSDGSQSLYKYGVTTGSAVDGKIITVRKVNFLLGYTTVQKMIDSYRKTGVNRAASLSTDEFTGRVYVDGADNGGVYVGLCLSLKDGEDNFYALINPDNFIGRDSD